MTPVNPVIPGSDDRPDPRVPDDDEIALGTHARRVWQYRGVIAAVALVCAGSAAAYSMMGSRKYQARVSVVIQPKAGEIPVPISTIRILLESKDVAAGVIQELKLDQPPHGVLVSTFFSDVATIEQTRDSPVLALTVELDDPALAARAANLIAERAVRSSRDVSQREAVRTRDDLEKQRDDAKARMEQAVGALRKFQETSQIELVRKDVEAMLVQRGELLPLSLYIEMEKAKLAVGEKELAARERITTVKRTIDADPALMEAARKAADANGMRLIGLETRNEYVNPVYESLDRQIATSRATLAELERKRAQLVDVRKFDAPRTALLTKVYGLENELARLTLERELVTGVYRQLATAYETARTQVASRSAQLEILDRAVAPDLPVSRHVARNAVLGFVIGLLLASFGALLHSTFSIARQGAAIS